MRKHRIAQIRREIAAGTYDLLPGTCPLGCVEFTAERLAQEIETMMECDKPVQLGDVVQIGPLAEQFARCLMIVDELKSWGVCGYIPIPGGVPPGHIVPYRCENGQFTRCGAAAWVEMKGD